MEAFLETHLKEDIQKHRLFSILSKKGQDRLIGVMLSNTPLIYPSGCTIVEEGQDSKCLFYIVKGKVRVTCSSEMEHSKSMVLQEISGRDFFGECDVLLQRKRSTCMYSDANSLVLRVYKNQLYEIFQQESDQTLVDYIYKNAQEDQSLHKDLLTQKLASPRRRASRDEEQDLQRGILIPGSQSNVPPYGDIIYSKDQHSVTESPTNEPRARREYRFT